MAVAFNYDTGLSPRLVYPRALVVLKILTVGGQEATTGLVPAHARVTFNPHHQAGIADLSIDASAMPFDWRRVGDIFVSVFLGDVGSNDGAVRQERYLRFVGYSDTGSRRRSNQGPHIEIKARDLSSVLRDWKPLPWAATPTYQDTLTQAVQRIYDAIGLTQDVLEIDDSLGYGTVSLSTLLGARGQKGRIPLKRDITAWGAVEHVAGLVGLLVSVELGQLRFRRPTDVFQSGAASKYTFVIGDNVKGNTFEHEEHKKFLRNRRGVRCVGFDPIARRPVEADYPTDGELLSRKRPPPTSAHRAKKRKTTKAPPEPDRDVFPIEGVQSADALAVIAKRLYLERSRQELEGRLQVKYWDEDLFALRNGDRATIKIRPDLEAQLRTQQGTQAQVDFLKAQLGMSDEGARALLGEQTQGAGDLYYIRSITHNWTPKGCATDVDFINIIEI